MVTAIAIFLMVASLGPGQDDPEAVEFFEQYPVPTENVIGEVLREIY